MSLFSVVLALVLSVSGSAWAQVDEARQALRSGRYERAEDLASKAMGARASRAQGALVLGRVQLETGRYEKAATTAAKIRGRGEVRASAQELRGEALLSMGRISDAIRALEAAVEAADDDSGWRARLLLARAHARNGNWLSARPLFDAIADGYNDGSISESDSEAMAAVASAVVELEYWQDGNETFAAAVKLDPERVETQTEWARLFLEKYDPGHAEECLRDALKANPNHAEAHLLMAKVRMAQGFDFVRATEELNKALATNPNAVEAHAFRATIELRDRLWEKAHDSIDRALDVDSTDPYALGVKAAAFYIADQERQYEETLAKLRRRDPRHTDHLDVLNEMLEWEHRYEEIIELNREALELDSSYWKAHGTIGLNLLRLGQEEEGLEALRKSWEHDRFNVLVYNTLNLYENVLSKEYTTVTRGPITYRFHRDEQKVLERYLPDLLSRGYREMSKRYGLRPRDTKVELFASEDHFARRSVGLPRVGVQGICFGKVIVAGGPRAAPVNYGQVLWHELGHVFTIQLSRSRVPRWFTEGVSVVEERRGSPSWVRDDDAALYRWIKAGRMPEVASLNTAFSRARSGVEIGLAYYGSAKLVEHIEQRHGRRKLLAMLKQFGRGKRTVDVVRSVLKMEPDELDREFRQAILQDLSLYAKNFQVDYGWHREMEAIRKQVKANPNDVSVLGEAAVAALGNRDKSAAQTFANKAIGIDPDARVARHVLADIAAATGDAAAAREHAQALISKGIDGYGLRLNLAEVATKSGDRDAAIRHLKAASKLDPQQAEPHMHLAKLHLNAKNTNAAIDEMQKAADLTPHDRGLYRELLGRLFKAKRWDDLRRYGERSLWNDPLNAELHLQLAEAYDRTGASSKAAFELESARLCEPEDSAMVELAVARRYHRRGRKRQAIRAARRAIEAKTKSSAEAQRFLEKISR